MAKNTLAILLILLLMMVVGMVGFFYVLDSDGGGVVNDNSNDVVGNGGILNVGGADGVGGLNVGGEDGGGILTELSYIENECLTNYDCADDKICLGGECVEGDIKDDGGSDSRGRRGDSEERCRYNRECGEEIEELVCRGDGVVKRIIDPVCDNRACSEIVEEELVENCSDRNGWYNTDEIRWIDEGECREKKQKKEEYRDYTCSGEGVCSYVVVNSRWINTVYVVNKEDGVLCSDDLFCTENDKCVVGICVGSAKTCSDAVGCTADFCDEVLDKCVNKPKDDLCDDGKFCNGLETCDASLGCQAGTSVSCAFYDILGIGSCNQDSNPFTWDFRSGFESECRESDGGYSCTQGDESVTSNCDKDKCGAECVDGECDVQTCSRTYNDYCDGKKLVEYDFDKKKDSTTVTGSCVSDCEDCVFPDCETDCSAPSVNEYYVKDVCGAQCVRNNQCSDDYYSENYCSAGDVYKDLHDFSCEEGGCEGEVTEKLVEECRYGCSGGECKAQEFSWEIFCGGANNNLISINGCCGEQCSSSTSKFLRIYKLKEVGYYYFKHGNRIEVSYGEGNNICRYGGQGGATSGTGFIPADVTVAGHYTTWNANGRVYTLYSTNEKAAVTCSRGANRTDFYWEDRGSPGEYNDGRIVFRFL